MSRLASFIIVTFALLGCGWSGNPAEAENAPAAANDIDARVQRFLDNHRYSRGDMSVPEVDGRALHNIIREHGYKNALEIGTSTGYSGVWIAWALSKTGGKLITVEIDRYRHSQALENFKEAGLSEYIDARLADAHELVPQLEGPFDFVFCDADKYWYTNYFKALVPKITIGGCFAAHNVSDWGYGGRRRGFGRGSRGDGFLEYARSLFNFDTEILNLRGSAGLSVSYKKAAD